MGADPDLEPRPWGPDSDDGYDEEMVIGDGLDPDEVAEREDIDAGVRARRLPYLAAAGVAATGYAAWGVVELATAMDGPEVGANFGAGTFLVTAAALPLLRTVWQHRIPEAWRSRWWLAAFAGAGWVDCAATVGPMSVPMTAALVIGTWLLGSRWAAEHEVPNPSQVVYPEPAPALPVPRPRPAPVEIESGLAVRIEEAWRTRVAHGESPIARESELKERTILTNGVRWRVDLDPGRGVGATTLAGRGDALALALQVSITDLILEVGEREDIGYITVTEGQALLGDLGYRGPEYRVKDNGDGVVPVGLEADGEHEAEWLACEAGQGVRNGMATGDMGSGKTALLELVALGLRKSGVWRVWWGDGDPQGSSSPLMMDTNIAHWKQTGPEGLLKQLAAFEALLESRSRLKRLLTLHPVTGLPVLRTSQSQPGLREIPPCPEFPAYMWLMPEFFTICQDPTLQAANFVLRLETALRRARKFGLGAAVDTQSALGADFGSSATLRAFLGMSNAFMMRTTNANEQFIVNGLTVSPGLLPKGGGHGLIANRGRVAPMKTYWQPDLHLWVPALPACGEDPDAVLALAPYVTVNGPDVELSLAEQQAEMERWRASARAGELPAADAAPATGAPEMELEGVSVPEPLTGKLLPFRPPAAAPKSEPTPEQQVVLTPGSKAAQLHELLLAHPGPCKVSWVIEETGWSRSDLSKAKGRLVSLGLAHDIAWGVFAGGSAPEDEETPPATSAVEAVS